MRVNGKLLRKLSAIWLLAMPLIGRATNPNGASHAGEPASEKPAEAARHDGSYPSIYKPKPSGAVAIVNGTVLTVWSGAPLEAQPFPDAVFIDGMKQPLDARQRLLGQGYLQRYRNAGVTR